MQWIQDFFPDDWFTDVIVKRSGGRDAKGNPLPATEFELSRCLIGLSKTADETGFSDVVASTITLRRTALPHVELSPTDRVVIPDGKRYAGEWAIEGEIGEYPVGIEVTLTRV